MTSIISNYNKGMITCNYCGVAKDESCYGKLFHRGRLSMVCCHECRRANKIAYLKQYRQDHKKSLAKKREKYYIDNIDEILNYQKDYRTNNKEKISDAKAIYYDTNHDEILAQKVSYNKKNKAKIAIKRIANRNKRAAQRRHRYKTDPLYRLACNIRRAMSRSIKVEKTQTLLGCSFEIFKTYIESKFLPGMTWDNYCYDGWHIDHIKPLSWFDITDPTQVAIANHYTNLQPLWAVDNLSKNNRYCG